MILAVGDSYVLSDSIQSYLGQVGLSLNMNIEVHGLPGQGFWSVRKKLFEVLDKIPREGIKILIICHPHYIRIPNKTNLPINPGTIDHLMNVNKLTLNQAEHLMGYWDNFLDRDNLLWQIGNWSREVNTEIFPESTKIINLHGTCTTFSRCSYTTGPNSIHILNSLYGLSLSEFNNHDEFMKFIGPEGADARLNHFSLENNKILARELYKLISKDFRGEYKFDKSLFSIKNSFTFDFYNRKESDML